MAKRTKDISHYIETLVRLLKYTHKIKNKKNLHAVKSIGQMGYDLYRQMYQHLLSARRFGLFCFTIVFGFVLFSNKYFLIIIYIKRLPTKPNLLFVCILF